MTATSSSTPLLQRRKLIRNRLEQIKNEEDLLTKENRAIDSALDTAAVAESQAWCSSFSCRMRERLPRELRDLIYDFLVAPKNTTIKVRDPNMTYRKIYHQLVQGWKNAGWEALAPDHYPYVPGRQYSDDPALNPTPYYMRADFVGTEVATEIAELLYAKARFKLKHFPQLSLFFQEDIFGTCAAPEKVRHLTICMKPDYDAYYDPEGRQGSSGMTGDQYRSAIFYGPGLDAIMGQLDKMQHAKVLLEFKSVRQADLGDLDHLLTPYIYKMKCRSMDVVVVQTRSKWSRAVLPYDFDVNRPLEEWERLPDHN
ncbi:hypothetical protein BDV96DRAFT_644458 [Lophiotrema nucula]|uniref:Uncharacterized protein n=1 Tax=Lophiotrema nucula TaxID=690887 RepID=A0A6A5ZC30_9PLEO|nr:hypothetical protein BDV96DRAFT_644458 [Lophiotrema nucula]